MHVGCVMSGTGGCGRSHKTKTVLAQACRAVAAGLFVAAVIAASGLTGRGQPPGSQSPAGSEVSQAPGPWLAATEVEPLSPIHEVSDTSSGHELVWQIPSSQPVVGVVFLAPGCSHRAVDFWPHSTGCEQCIGLPEETQITRAALKSGLAVLAVSTAGKGTVSTCWDTQTGPDYSTDVPHVARVLRQWIQAKGMQNLPVYAIGASSGGTLVLMLAQRFRFTAICSQIAGGSPHIFQLQPRDQATGGTWNYPPTLFVHMPRDHRTSSRVASSMKTLTAQGVPSAEVAVLPQPVTAGWLTMHLDDMPLQTALAVLERLRNAHLIDQIGYLAKNPRRSKWRTALAPIRHLPGLKGDSLVADKSPLSELLNVLYADHEIVAEYMEQTLKWFQQWSSPASY